MMIEKSKNTDKQKRKYEKVMFDKNTVEQTEQYRKNGKNKKKAADHEKLDKISNPRDITIDHKKREMMGLNKRSRNDMENASQIMPLPKNQTKETLSIKKPSDLGDMYNELGNKTCMELYRINIDLNRKRNRHEFPMEELIAVNILSPYVMSLDEQQNRMSKQGQVDIKYVADQFIQLHHSGDDDTIRRDYLSQKLLEDGDKSEKELSSFDPLDLSLKKRRKRNKSEGLTTVKLKTVFNRFEFPFGFESSDSTTNRLFLTQEHTTDAEKRKKLCYIYDKIERNTEFCLAPKRYKMFRQLVHTHMEKYKQRDNLLKDAVDMIPLTDLEEVSREYITFYRQKPTDQNIQLCFNGQNCVCYTFSTDPLVRYIGISFFTERQLEQKKNGIRLTHNEEGLCIDCLLKEWTLKHTNNIARGFQPKCAFNHFTVIVGEGQYNQDCMLKPYYNRRLTGIMGHVPRYDRNKREVIMISKRQLDKKGVSPVSHDNYIGEAGMDF